MTKLHILILVMCIALFSGCRTNGILIEGARFENDTLVPLKGYSLVLQEGDGRNTVVLFKNDDGGIRGTFFCGCIDSPDSYGGCQLDIHGSAMNCVPTVCKDCSLVVSIPSLMGGKFYRD